MPDTGSPPFLSPEALGERLGVGPNTVRRWIALGQVEGVQRTPSGRYRIPLDVAERIIRGVLHPEPAALAQGRRP